MTGAATLPGASERAKERRLILVALAAALAAQIAIGALVHSALDEGRLLDIDGYTRLVRARDLHATGAWLDPVEHRANAPFGVASHWTRPLDALLLGGAALLTPALGFERALYWTGVAISPLLYLLTAAVLAWAARPLLSPAARLLMLLAFPLQLVMLLDSAPGMADHHALLLLVLAAALGLLLRTAQAPAPGDGPCRATAAACGACFALGLWISTEFFPLALLAGAALGLGWILHGGGRAARNAWQAAGLAAGAVVALLVERGLAALRELESDRLSLLHVLPCIALALFWAAAASPRAAPLVATRTRRAVAAAIAALPVAALLAWVVRVALAEAALDTDPHVSPFFDTPGLRPLLPTDGATTAAFLLELGAALVAVPWLLVRLRREGGRPEGECWLAFAALGLGQLVGALRLGRLAGGAELLLLVPLGALAAQALAPLAARPPGARRVLSGAARTAAILLGPLAVGAALVALSPPEPDINAFRPSDLRPLYPVLDALGEGPLTILSLPGDAPEILYRTRHRTVAYPQHRGLESIRDCLIVYETDDEELARRIVEARQVDLIVVPAAAGGVLARCAAGACPPWLRQIHAGAAEAAGVLIYAVDR